MIDNIFIVLIIYKKLYYCACSVLSYNFELSVGTKLRKANPWTE